MGLVGFYDLLSTYGKLANHDSQYLYRGLRSDEIESGTLIPKGIRTFEAVKLMVANASGTIESTSVSSPAIHDHLMGLPTKGVSTSTKEEVAKQYAGQGFIARIDRKIARSLGVKEVIVKDEVPLRVIPKPEDEEVILVGIGEGPLPKEVVQIYHVNN